MTKIVFKRFSGEIPKTAPHLLPDQSAQQAINCQFDSGELTPVATGVQVATMANNPARAVYTEDGLLWYSWPQETIAVRAPILEDSYNRIYYLTPAEGIVKAVSKLGMANNGPTPVGGVRAGVPGPTNPPVLTLRDRTTLPDYPSITVSATAWWVDATNSANTTSRVPVTCTALVALRVFQIDKPPVDAFTPPFRKMASTLTFTDTTTGLEIFSLSTYAGGTSRSQAVPGTVEGVLSEEPSRGVWRLTWGVMETRAYTYTVANTWDEEGAPAPPALISPTYVQDVQIDVEAQDFTGMRPFQEYRIYRTYGNVPTYIGVDAVQDGSVSTRFYDGTTKANSVKEALESEDWAPAPLGMETLVISAAGFLAGSKGTSVWITEVYKPHAWAYQHIFPTAVRGLFAAQQCLVVTCADGVYLLVGDNPAAMQPIKLVLPQPGVSQRSMTAIDGAVCYVSRDGLPLVMGSNGTMEMSQKLFTRKKWLERYEDIIDDASIMLAYHDGYVVAVSRTTNKGFVIRMDEDVGSFIQTTDRYDAMQLLPIEDSLYYALGANIYRFRGGALIDYDWWSKDFITPRYESFGAVYIDCDVPVLMTVYAEGVQAEERMIGKGHHRLSTMNASRRWSIRLRGKAVVKEMVIATSMEELQSV